MRPLHHDGEPTGGGLERGAGRAALSGLFGEREPENFFAKVRRKPLKTLDPGAYFPSFLASFPHFFASFPPPEMRQEARRGGFFALGGGWTAVG